MPGFTDHLSLRYPLITEIVTAQSYQDLANDIDAQFTATAAIRAQNLNKPNCFTATVAGTSTAVNTFVNVSFTNNFFANPSSIHSTSVNPDQFVIPLAGLYMFVGSARTNGAFTTFTGFEIGESKNGTSNYLESGTYSATGGNAMVKGLQFCVAGDILRIFTRWTGTGGPTTVQASAQLYMIAQL